ncbi:MAG: hypothetical protein A2X25_02910 [Chloroflexi bacterium GWB2_49_20]|nr:MAG: hypothetical protein A2X25_02910 [Chloroflexi bacterium GWB2_49_20]OGN78749.1 MAG: hypothetical protein A2X26_12870 [Chloroflexi bacterium GWC2_49_37]OGN85881.1 MAG: hypothetical protein A2X27_11815 [Chloroflexi bacterium GWD2_49_16]
MSKLQFHLLLVCALFLTGCAGVDEPTQSTVIPINPSPTVSPSQTLTPTPTIPIEKTLPNPTVSSDVTLPALFYILDNKLFEQVGDPPGKEIANLPDADQILAAFRTGNILLVMREQGIQRLKLSDSTTEMIFNFDKPARYGNFISASEGHNVFFITIVDDPQAEFSMACKVGFYDLNLDTITPVITYPNAMRILGSTKDNLGLYLLYTGQSTDFGRIFLVDIKKGEIAQELAFQGELVASLAPDGRLLATLNPSYDPLENTLGIFDLTSLPGTPPRTYKLPKAPSFIPGSFLWSPDSRILYFNLMSGYYWDAPPSGPEPYGLWQLDTESGEMSQPSNGTEAAFYLERISTDGEWLLLRGREEVIWVNAYTGAQKAIGLPGNAFLVGGQ